MLFAEIDQKVFFFKDLFFLHNFLAILFVWKFMRRMDHEVCNKYPRLLFQIQYNSAPTALNMIVDTCVSIL